MPFERLHPALGGRSGPDAVPFSSETLERSGAEMAFLATPNEISAEIVPELLDRGIRVIDIAGAFRLRDASAYPPGTASLILPPRFSPRRSTA